MFFFSPGSYTSDYTTQKGTGLSDSAQRDATVYNLTPTICAYQCSQQDTCQHFQFCDGRCTLVNYQTSTRDVTTNSFCDFYTKTGMEKFYLASHRFVNLCVRVIVPILSGQGALVNYQSSGSFYDFHTKTGIDRIIFSSQWIILLPNRLP